MVEFRMVIPELAALRARFRQGPAIVREEELRAMHVAVLLAEGEVVRRTPVKTGRARNAISSRVSERPWGITGFVESLPLKYMRPLEFGTKPHVINAKNAKALRFVPSSGGGAIFRRSVHHPGTKGAHMFRDGMRAAWPLIRAVFAEALARITSRLSGKSTGSA